MKGATRGPVGVPGAGASGVHDGGVIHVEDAGVTHAKGVSGVLLVEVGCCSNSISSLLKVDC